MGMLYEDLEELCHTVEKDLEKTNEKLRMSGGEISGSDMEYINKLTHTLKSIKTTMAMMDADDGYSRDNMGGTSGRRYPMYGTSYARGRGGYARRDSMGRFSRRGYSGADNSEMVEQLRDMMDDAPDDKIRQEIQKLVTKMESM